MLLRCGILPCCTALENPTHRKYSQFVVTPSLLPMPIQVGQWGVLHAWRRVIPIVTLSGYRFVIARESGNNDEDLLHIENAAALYGWLEKEKRMTRGSSSLYFQKHLLSQKRLVSNTQWIGICFPTLSHKFYINKILIAVQTTNVPKKSGRIVKKAGACAKET